MSGVVGIGHISQGCYTYTVIIHYTISSQIYQHFHSLAIKFNMLSEVTNNALETYELRKHSILSYNLQNVTAIIFIKKQRHQLLICMQL